MKKVFETSATNTGGRAGHVTSDDGVIDLDVAMPNESDKAKGTYTNPEQLFAAAYASCFAGAVELVAGQSGVEDMGDYSVKATVSFNTEEEGAFIEVILDTYLPTVEKKKAEKIINKAHKICPYSKATRDNITVHLNLLMDE